MNPILLILGGGAVLWYLTQDKAPAATSTPTTPKAPTTTTPTATPATNIQPPAAPPPALTLAKLYSDLVSAMQQHPDVTDSAGSINATFSQFNWYLTSVAPSLAVSGMLPDYYAASGGQTDPNTPINIATYWGIMQPWLAANKGLSGLGRRQHPGILWRSYTGPGGWRA